jgi:uncharacterized integral membrane protein
MFRLISFLLLFLVVVLVGWQFARINTTEVSVNYFLDTVNSPLSAVIVSAFSLGVVVALIVAMLVVIPLRMRVSSLRSALTGMEREVSTLRRRAVRGS